MYVYFIGRERGREREGEREGEREEKEREREIQTPPNGYFAMKCIHRQTEGHLPLSI